MTYRLPLHLNGHAKRSNLAPWLLLAPFVVVWRGIVLRQLWLWFLTPLTELRPSLAQCVGIVVTGMLFVSGRGPSGEPIDRVVGAFVVPAAALAIGWCATFFL